MLKSLHWLLGRGAKAVDLSVFQKWADLHGCQLLRVRHGPGCVVPARLGSTAWRIEWGSPQRGYIAGSELRLIAELQLPSDLMALVLNRQLLDDMERSVYEQFVDDVQTRIDSQTPAEMRWLVLHPKLAGSELGRLREHFGATGNSKPWLTQWLQSGFGDALVAAVPRTGPEHPVVITVGRGRLLLRTEMAQPDAQLLSLWVGVFEQALRQALSMGLDRLGDHSAGGQPEIGDDTAGA